MSQGFHTVHVRVNDTATGRPTPCRVRFTGADGAYYAPFGRVTEFATGRGEAVGGNVQLGAKRFALIDGSCEISLPAGMIGVEIHKGPEYRPIVQEMSVGLGKMALRFTLERWCNLRDRGWFSGDGRVHFLAPHAALLEGAAEDLAVVNVLAQEGIVTDAYGHQRLTVPNILEFSGQSPALEMPGHLVAVNTHNCHPVLGSLGLLHSHRPVYPLAFGGPKGFDDWSLADWCGQCHRKKGLVIWTRIGQGLPEHGHGEALANLILGDVDAVEIDFYEDSPFDMLGYWYEFLNSGTRVPLVGSSAKASNGMAAGAMRTYARLPEGVPLNYPAWIEAVRAGRTFVTNGPLLTFTVQDADPGTHLMLPTAGQRFQIHAAARSLVPFELLELVVNGTVVAQQPAHGEPCSASLEMELSPPESGWIAARCRGQALIPHRPSSQRVFAHSAPIYFTTAGRQPFVASGSVGTLLAHLDRTAAWVSTKARCRTEKQREHLAAIISAARAKLAALVEPTA